jgi:hypothetical protein
MDVGTERVNKPDLNAFMILYSAKHCHNCATRARLRNPHIIQHPGRRTQDCLGSGGRVGIGAGSPWLACLLVRSSVADVPSKPPLSRRSLGVEARQAWDSSNDVVPSSFCEGDVISFCCARKSCDVAEGVLVPRMLCYLV